MMVPRYWSWACVVPRNCITGKNSKTGKGPKWCVKMERHPKLGDKVKPPTEVEIPSSLCSFRTEAASLRPPECGWQDVKDLMRERGIHRCVACESEGLRHKQRGLLIC